MKGFILNLFIFGTILILLLVFISKCDNLDNKTSNNQNIIRLQNKSSFDNLDILFIGNSYCYSGIIPSYFDEVGITSFNLGTATAGPYFYELIINDYLEFTKVKPKSIFILVSPTSFSSRADNFSLFPIHRYLENPKTNEEIMLQYGLTNQYLNLFIKSIRKGIENLISKRTANEDNTVIEAKGWFTYKGINSDKMVRLTQSKYIPFKNESFNQQYFAYSRKVVKQLEAKGIEIVFFELPTNMLEEYFNTQYLLSYKEAIERLKSNYIFFSNDLKLENECFRNIDHLNTKGAEITTQNLIGKIKENARLRRRFNIGH